LHHRAPGPAGVLLDDERVTVELIADQVHVHPTMLRLAAGCAGPNRTVLITDASPAAAAPDGRYPWGKLEIDVCNGVAKSMDGATLAGSTLTMDAAFRNIVTTAGYGILDAVQATASKPAELLGVQDRTGAICPGLD